MIKHIKNTTLTLLLLITLSVGYAQQQRFPQPEFESGYQMPTTTTPEPRAFALEYIDLALLVLVLSITSWLALRKRSRKGILWLSIFSLLYFGFYREGCICVVGSVQNIALSLFNSEYAVPLSVLGFFLIPLLFTLAFGRLFCATACPLGVIQDLVIVRHIRVPLWLQKVLGLFPFIYLGLAILYAATATDFLICRYDPFVGIFRMSGEFHLMVLGVGFLLAGMFVGRPYCRFVCPYGALLKITSMFSKRHLTITPAGCINCKLCADSCPFDAIEEPTTPLDRPTRERNAKRILLLAALTPIIMIIGGWALSQAHPILARAHSDVYLANLMVTQPDIIDQTDNLDIITFLSSGQTLDELVQEATIITARFRKGAWYLGAFIGLILGLSIIRQVASRSQSPDYRPNKGNCLSCGRCIKYCPVERD